MWQRGLGREACHGRVVHEKVVKCKVKPDANGTSDAVIGSAMGAARVILAPQHLKALADAVNGTPTFKTSNPT